jgi:hypothetical protein
MMPTNSTQGDASFRCATAGTLPVAQHLLSGEQPGMPVPPRVVTWPEAARERRRSRRAMGPKSWRRLASVGPWPHYSVKGRRRRGTATRSRRCSRHPVADPDSGTGSGAPFQPGRSTAPRRTSGPTRRPRTRRCRDHRGTPTATPDRTRCSCCRRKPRREARRPARSPAKACFPFSPARRASIR